MRRDFKFLFSSLALTLIAVPAAAQYTPQTINAAQYLGAEYMQGPYHRVMPQARSDGKMLHYTIETPNERMVVIGTEQTKDRIQELHATETLRGRSTGGAILGSAKDRTTNLVKTPYRIGKTLVNRAGNISNVGEAILFAPEQVGQTAGTLLHGVGELGVTAIRITKGAAGTKCSGLDCVEKAGSDIWSGVNSLAGKHNASRRLHAEFGTDPQTNNKAYRRQIDRLAYANSYTGTTIKLGAGQAGIDYLSPAFTGVGYVNNTEFVGKYEDAHREKNYEKNMLRRWGANPQAIDNFYRNKAYTKHYRRRFFKALATIPDKAFSVRLLHEAADTPERYKAKGRLVTAEYITSLAARGDIAAYHSQSPQAFITSHGGTNILVVYADYLQLNHPLEAALFGLSQHNGLSALHVLGHADPRVKHTAKQLNVQIVEWPDRGL